MTCRCICCSGGSRPSGIKGGGWGEVIQSLRQSPKTFFSAPLALVWSKNKGGRWPPLGLPLCCNLWQTIMWKYLLQKVALENEQGTSDNPLKISWLEVPTSATDKANSETVPEASNSAKEAMVESKVQCNINVSEIIIPVNY